MNRLLSLLVSIRSNLTADLLKGEHKASADVNPVAGHCYVASETLYHLLEGKESGLKPCSGKVSGKTHWWLEDETGEVLDPTADQFPDGFPYQTGRGRGFLTSAPSKRAQTLIDRVLAPEDPVARAQAELDSATWIKE